MMACGGVGSCVDEPAQKNWPKMKVCQCFLRFRSRNQSLLIVSDATELFALSTEHACWQWTRVKMLAIPNLRLHIFCLEVGRRLVGLQAEYTGDSDD